MASLLASLVLCAVIAQPASALTPKKYIDTPSDEWTVAVGAGVRAWAVTSPAHPLSYAVWVKRGAAPPYRVTPLTSFAEVGNLELGNSVYGDVLTYDIGRTAKTQFDVKLWNLTTRRFIALPSGINTPKNEEHLSISGDELVFDRGPVRTSFGATVFLYNLTTHRLTAIARAAPGAAVAADSISGDFVLYTVCYPSGVCQDFRRRISTGGIVKVPNPGRALYYGTVMTDGTVYYVQGSAKRCGDHTKLMRWQSGVPTTLATLPQGVDAGPTAAYFDGSSTTLYFTRAACRGPQYATGIYQITHA